MAPGTTSPQPPLSESYKAGSSLLIAYHSSFVLTITASPRIVSRIASRPNPSSHLVPPIPQHPPLPPPWAIHHIASSTMTFSSSGSLPAYIRQLSTATSYSRRYRGCCSAGDGSGRGVRAKCLNGGSDRLDRLESSPGIGTGGLVLGSPGLCAFELAVFPQGRLSSSAIALCHCSRPEGNTYFHVSLWTTSVIHLSSHIENPFFTISVNYSTLPPAYEDRRSEVFNCHLAPKQPLITLHMSRNTTPCPLDESVLWHKAGRVGKDVVNWM